MDTNLLETIKSKIIFYQGSNYSDCYWEIRNNQEVIEFEHYNKTLQYVVIENNCVCAFLLNERYDVDIPETITTEEKTFTVKYVFIRCMQWNVTLPKSIETVMIDRELSNNQDFNREHPFGNSENSSFYVVDDNPLFCSVRGSLYSKDCRVLYHFHFENKWDKSVLDENLEEIAPEAIYCPNGFYYLHIPQCVNKLMAKAIVGKFREIIFKGKLTNIEGELEWDSDPKDDFVIKINGLLRDLSVESRAKLNHWRKKKYSRKIIFAAPPTIQNHYSKSGGILLTGVIEDNHHGRYENRLDYNKDYKDVLLYTSLADGGQIAITAEEKIMENLFEPVKGSHVKFFAKDDNNREEVNYVDVYEAPEDVNQIIADLKKQMQQVHS